MESPSFKKETKEDVRNFAEREVRRLEDEINELEHQLNGIFAQIGAGNEKVQDDYLKDPSKDTDLGILNGLGVLQTQREDLERKIEKKAGELSQLRIALKKG